MGKTYAILFVKRNNTVTIVGVLNGKDNDITTLKNVHVAIKQGDIFLIDINGGEKDYYVSELKDTTIIYRED